MLDWTDRHCRYLHRLLSRRARLYTEMVSTGALLHGSPRVVEDLLRFDPSEHPLALQLGGSDPKDLARCARLAVQRGFDEINLNCGCPSPRVQRGAFGACLMREPKLVAECFAAMREAAGDAPVTLKHRIGLERDESTNLVQDFVGTLYEAGCRVFIVHARNAWLQGLSPKQNREVPPLRHGVAAQLKRQWPEATVVVNGGIADDGTVQQLLAQVDGVMIGRAAWHRPWWLASWDGLHFGDPPGDITREGIEARMVDYMQTQARQHGTAWATMARPMLGLRHGLPGARRWRQAWSDHRLRHLAPREVMRLAHEQL